MSKERVQGLLESAFPGAEHIQVIDRAGGDHLEVRITDPVFDGLSLLQQHRLVYAAVDEPMKDGSIHELRIKTKGTQS